MYKSRRTIYENRTSTFGSMINIIGSKVYMFVVTNLLSAGSLFLKCNLMNCLLQSAPSSTHQYILCLKTSQKGNQHESEYNISQYIPFKPLSVFIFQYRFNFSNWWKNFEKSDLTHIFNKLVQMHRF